MAADFYRVAPGRIERYGRAELSFLRRTITRGVLNTPPGYRAHNASVVTGYLDHEPLTATELPAERFVMNVTLVRAFYAHALAAAPRLALGVCSATRGVVDFFLDLRQVFPQICPLEG
jgi:hypothetical protein